MKEKILELEKSLFKVEYMNNKTYLDKIISDDYLEVGKSGTMIRKDEVINDLSILKEDRKIKIYNFECIELSPNIYLIHYITLNNNDKIYRTSIWKKEEDIKIYFHQASLLKEDLKLIED